MRGRKANEDWAQKAKAAAERKYGMSLCWPDNNAPVFRQNGWSWVPVWVKVEDEEVG
jgi:hypothetical protein